VGTVVISIDAELGWGHHDRPDPPAERVENARRGWVQLLHLLDEYEIPATWAVVGHLFLDDCDGEHVDHPSPEGWFDRERGEWRLRPELRFGYGLVDAVRSSSVDHEIGSHSFSHVELGNASRDLARAELAESVDAASDASVELESFVYPRHQIGHLDLLSEHGFTCYRGLCPDRASSHPLGLPTRKVARTFLPNLLPPLVEPETDECGLVNIPASLYLFGAEGAFRTVVETLWRDPMAVMARKGIDAAARRDGEVFHLWLHPNDITGVGDAHRVEAILRYLARRREESPLSVETMGSVAERVRH